MEHNFYYIKCPALNVTIFITHKRNLRNLRNGCYANVSTEQSMLINDKMPAITPSENLKARKFFILQHFSFYKQLKFHSLRVELSMKISSGNLCPIFLII